MTTPKDTWISVNTDMRPNKVPEGYIFIVYSVFDDIVQFPSLNTKLINGICNNKAYTHFMLLSKPKTTNQ